MVTDPPPLKKKICVPARPLIVTWWPAASIVRSLTISMGVAELRGISPSQAKSIVEPDGAASIVDRS
jgi:hypothetical protein